MTFIATSLFSHGSPCTNSCFHAHITSLTSLPLLSFPLAESLPKHTHFTTKISLNHSRLLSSSSPKDLEICLCFKKISQDNHHPLVSFPCLSYKTPLSYKITYSKQVFLVIILLENSLNSRSSRKSC